MEDLSRGQRSAGLCDFLATPYSLALGTIDAKQPMPHTFASNETHRSKPSDQIGHTLPRRVITEQELYQ